MVNEMFRAKILSPVDNKSKHQSFVLKISTISRSNVWKRNMIANQDFTASATLTLGAMALFQPYFAKYYQKAIFLNSGHSVSIASDHKDKKD